LGLQCHSDLEKDWRTPAGQILVSKWARQFMRRDVIGGFLRV
jgi:hypothetical protein